MQPMLLTDYLLGNSFHKKYKDTFVEQAPTFIHSLRNIEFIRDKSGNYKFKDQNELYMPFIELSYRNKSVGNFFIVFQRYLNNPINIIQESKLDESTSYDFKEDINCFINPKYLIDDDKERVEGVFVSLVPENNELVIIYFYKNSEKIGHLRTNLTNIKLGLNLRNIDRQVLTLLSYYESNKNNLTIYKDDIKTKYRGRFTEQEYIKI